MSRRVVFLVAPLVIPLLLSSASCLAQPSASFTTRTTSVSRQVAQTIAVDVNNDGIPDVVSITYDPDNQIAVNLANGDGTFAPTKFYSLPNDAWAITSGDFNGDGKVDLVVSVYATGGAQMMLLAGNGDGTFQAAKTVATLPNKEETDASIAAADFQS